MRIKIFLVIRKLFRDKTVLCCVLKHTSLENEELCEQQRIRIHVGNTTELLYVRANASAH